MIRFNLRHRKILAYGPIFATLVVVAFGALTGTTSAASVVEPVAVSQPAQAVPSSFTIVNYGSGLCLQPSGTDLGSPIVQMPCDSTNLAQRWFLSRATTTRYLIVNVRTNMCMDVRDGENANGTIVQRWSCNLRVPSMRWQLSTIIPDLYFKIISEIGSKCLDVRFGSLEPGALIQIYKCTTGTTNTAQIFAIQ